MTDVAFPCTECGACCKHVAGPLTAARMGQIADPEIARMLLEFPYGHDEKGACSMLGADGLCKVYGDRPDLCNIRTLFLKVYAHRRSWKEHCIERAQACNVLQEREGMSKKWRVDLEQFK